MGMPSAWLTCGLMLSFGKEKAFEEDIFPICKQYTIKCVCLFVCFDKFMAPFFMKMKVMLITLFSSGDPTAKGCPEANLYLQSSEASYYSLYSKVKSLSLSIRCQRFLFSAVCQV